MKSKRAVPPRSDALPLMRDLGICAFLFVLVVAVFMPVSGFEFLLYDDGRIVYENPNIASGLRWENVVWAFTHAHFAIWMPLTSISHMLDASLFGSWAGGHHLTGIVWHGLAAIMLFLALNALTRRPWLSAACAALFAVHPQRAEALGWVSSRKEILCGLFFFSALWAYARYARAPSARRMALVVLFAACALMSKPMAVTLPFVLLLLDWWPLQRVATLETNRFGRIGVLLEKTPLFLLAAATSVVAVLTQPHVAEITAMNTPPFPMRAASAVLSYARYLGNSLYPVPLAAHYPPLDADSIHLGMAAGSAVLLTAITAVVLACRRRAYLAAGWFWFLGTLVPVLGLIQYGNAAMADRYTYIPQVGLLVALVWGVADVAARLGAKQPANASSATGRRNRDGVLLRTSHRRMAYTVSAVAILLFGCAALCRWQLAFWRNTETIFERGAALQPHSALAYANLGMVALQKGDKEKALRHYREAVRLEPDHAVWLYNLGSMLVLIRHYGEAADILRRSLEQNPDNPPALANLGICRLEKGDAEGALGHFDAAIRLNPERANYFINRADALSKLGRAVEAIESLERALSLEPGNREATARLTRARQAAGNQ